MAVCQLQKAERKIVFITVNVTVYVSIDDLCNIIQVAYVCVCVLSVKDKR